MAQRISQTISSHMMTGVLAPLHKLGSVDIGPGMVVSNNTSNHQLSRGMCNRHSSCNKGSRGSPRCRIINAHLTNSSNHKGSSCRYNKGSSSHRMLGSMDSCHGVTLAALHTCRVHQCRHMCTQLMCMHNQHIQQ